MTINKQLLCFYIIIACSIATVRAAPLTIEITQGIEDATPIAIVPFGFNGVQPPPAVLTDIVSEDLARSGQFKPLPAKDMLAKPTDINNIKYQNWRLLDIEHLVIGNISHVAGRYEVEFWIVDVFKGKVFDTKFRISGSRDGFRAIAHGVSDIIYERLTGVRGAFSTYLSYITAKFIDKSRYYTLWVSDADNVNDQPIFESKEPLLTPKWSPDGKKIAYSSLEKGGHQLVFVQNWVTSERQQIGKTKEGMYGSPAWSPNGKQLAVHVIKDGNAEIYVIDLATKLRRQLTRHLAIDTEPVWTPDGNSIIFTSDRGGSPQLYKMSARGGRAERLTFEGRENSRATISPDGKLLAMVHRNNGKFQIAVMELESGNLRVLTDGALDESPSFAPNGTMIIYAATASHRGADKGVLAAVSIDGQIQQQLSSQDDDEVREPSWSPFKQ